MNSTNKTANILIVDDDPYLRKILAWTLSHAGFGTATAADGEEALACLTTETIDAVVSDVRMPRMDGLQLLQTIRTHFRWRPIILVTGEVSDEIRSAASVWDAQGVFEKPVDYLELIAALMTALDEPIAADFEFIPTDNSPRYAEAR